MAKKPVGAASYRGGKAIPLLKSEIEDAQRNTTSNTQAAKWLSVSHPRYKRYAKIYNLYDRHANPLGLGTRKGFGSNSRSIPLRDIFANTHPKYSMLRLKYRMVARNMLDEVCGICGFNEKRLTDKKTPLMLTFKDKMKDYTRSNLYLLCYNCMFLTTGAPWVAHQQRIKGSLLNPDSTRLNKNDVPKHTDSLDPIDDAEMEQIVTEHQSDFHDIKDEILRDLGR